MLTGTFVIGMFLQCQQRWRFIIFRKIVQMLRCLKTKRITNLIFCSKKFNFFVNTIGTHNSSSIVVSFSTSNFFQIYCTNFSISSRLIVFLRSRFISKLFFSSIFAKKRSTFPGVVDFSSILLIIFSSFTSAHSKKSSDP